jgi:dihydroorotase
MSTRSYLIKGVSVVGAAPTDLLLRDGVVAETGRGLTGAGAEVIDADGLIALPGLVDLHTHLREPGREDAETVATGSRAAALGGYTAVCAMANTDPTADTAGVVEQVWRLGREAGLVDVQPVGAVTVGVRGQQLAELGAMADSAARVRIFSDDGNCVSDPRLMRRGLEYVKAFDGVIAQHCEERGLTQGADPAQGAQMHEGVVSARLGLAGWPAVAEEAIVARDVLLAEHVGARLHICHVSTAGSVEILRWAKRRAEQSGRPGRITAEVTPHHLLLTDELASTYDPVYKANPPLRTAQDVAAVRAGLIEGVIDAVATDHAPHALQDKECEWAYARPGILGLETALSIVALTLLDELGWEGIAQRMSSIPARIAGLDEHGHAPAPGRPATLTLVDPAAQWTVDPACLASRSRNTPYVGMRLPARVMATFLRGVATVLDAKAVR